MGQTNRTVIVTGGAQGIGMAIVRRFALESARVVIADVDAEAGEEIEAELKGEGQKNVRFIETDVGDEASVKRMIDTCTADGGAIHVLVNNAGIGWIGTIFDRRIEDWDRVLGVNLRGPYLCAMYALPHMPPDSAIVNIASTRALMSEPNTEPYSASKGGVLALTHALAVTLAERQVRVNAISPGWIDVSNWRKRATREQATLSPQDHAQHPAGRVGVPDDIARLCVYLADSGKSGFITGQNFVVDGGMTKRMIYEE